MTLRSALATAEQIRLLHQQAQLLDGLSHFPEQLRLRVSPTDMLELAVQMGRLHDSYQEILASLPQVA